MMENSASPLPEATAPIVAVELATSPATGACTCTEPPSGSVSFASGWPEVTVSPASTRMSATFSPGRSGRTAVSCRGMMMPDASTIEAKQAFAALSTVTAAPFGASDSSAASAGCAAPRAMRPAASRAGHFRERASNPVIPGRVEDANPESRDSGFDASHRPGMTESSLRLEVPGLRRRQRGELAAIRLEVQQRRLVEAIEAAHQHRRAPDANELDDRGTDRVRPHRRAQRECASGGFVVFRTLQHEIAARQIQPVDHFAVGVEIDALQRRPPRLENLQPADGAVVT